MRLFRFLLVAFVTTVLIYALNTKLGPVPPLGKFLDPFTGFWQNAETHSPALSGSLHLSGLQGKVTVQFDEHLVPHIFAGNDHDLYYTQGYLTAYLRLFQTELTSRATEGSLAEVFGPAALDRDKKQRRLGMRYGAEVQVANWQKDSLTHHVLTAYTEGFNAYVDHLKPKDYPVEYKLLAFTPSRWTPLRTGLLRMALAADLAMDNSDYQMSNVLAKLGPEATNELFPDYPAIEDPIIPSGTKWDFKPLPIPAKPKFKIPHTLDRNLAQINKYPLEKDNPDIGSNNWAISGTRTASGYPILASDPHLHLTLPSIWLQMQLNSPGVNVYGVTLPGAPGVVIGFNNDIAWGETNVGSDVWDWYKIEFKDASHTAYKYNGTWRNTTPHYEVIHVKGLQDVIDTVIYTHHGPVPFFTAADAAGEGAPAGYAFHWEALAPSAEFLTLYKLNRGRTYDNYVSALSHWNAPAQNFVFADNQKDIAIWVNGKLPLKWKEQGKYLSDGSDPAYDWHGYIPREQNPHIKNPTRGFVSSANQFSADTTYPYYLDFDFESYERGMRINQRLAMFHRATPDSLRLLQLDEMNLHAQSILPTLLRYLKPEDLRGEGLKAYQALKAWPYQNDAKSIPATVFSVWWFELTEAIWADDLGGPLLKYPRRDRTAWLILHKPDAPWYDDSRTPAHETITDLVNQSYAKAVDSLSRQHGSYGQNWAWGHHKGNIIAHLAGKSLAPFGRGPFDLGGGPGIVNAITLGNTGPSWRMVVGLGPTPEAYGTYPGGQSGNPGSRYYDDMIPIWVAGKLTRLLYLQKPAVGEARIQSTVTLEK